MICPNCRAKAILSKWVGEDTYWFCMCGWQRKALLLTDALGPIDPGQLRALRRSMDESDWRLVNDQDK